MNAAEREGRALRFQAIVDGGEMRELFDIIERQFIDEWKSAQTPDERENCHKVVRIIGLLRQNMATIAAGEPGKAANLRRLK